MKTTWMRRWSVTALVGAAGLIGAAALVPAEQRPTSFMKVDNTEPFESVVERMSAAKPQVMETHQKLLEQRYDLADRPHPSAKMSRGKPVQTGVRAKLP